jgi:bifunctional non-homologous end joining protein LigD
VGPNPRERRPYGICPGSSKIVVYAFDLLWLNGEDLRALPLLKRKSRLKKLIGKRSTSRLLYLDHIEGNGSRFFAKACGLDLEGIVAKWKTGAYIVDNRRSTWVKNQKSEL